VIPDGAEFYRVDYVHCAFREFFLGNPWYLYPVIALNGAIVKLGKLHVPGSSDHPAVASLEPFETAWEDFPADIRERFEPLVAALRGLGFTDRVCHRILDPYQQTRIWWADLRHESGLATARVHHRIWDRVRPARTYLFVEFRTALADGRWVLSSSGKPDTLEAPLFHVNRRPGMSAAALWESHYETLRALGVDFRAAMDTAHLRRQIAESHECLRAFHAKRGFFQPLGPLDRHHALSAQADGGDETAAVHAEMLRRADAKPGWNTPLLLLVSLAAFLAAGSGTTDWRFVALTVGILLVHEAGHWVAMRVFGYRNLRMFFIPWFGAAVSGLNHNVTGWKKALVSLAGPLPSIALALGVGGLGMATGQRWLEHTAFVALVLNGLNLLPVLPLDGGWVVHATLFCRHPGLETVFRILAALACIALGLAMKTVVLPLVGLLSLFRVPLNHRLGCVADKLRAEAIPLPAADDDGIPLETATPIIRELRATLPGTVGRQALALHALGVFENLNARPPGVPGTLGILALHAAGFVVAVAGVVFLALRLAPHAAD